MAEQIIAFGEPDNYRLSAEDRARIKRQPIAYPGDMVPLETLQSCGIRAINKADVLSSLEKEIAKCAA